MPNRILKDSIATSDNLNACSPEAQMLFIRLITRADDYGRFEARAAIVRGFCYPLALDRITDQHITCWLFELEQNRLIHIYQGDDGVPYLYLTNWEKHQRVRNKRSRYPQPSAQCGNPPQSAARCSESPQDAPTRAESNPDPNPIRIQSDPPVVPLTPDTPDGAPATGDDPEDDIPEMTPLEDELRQLPAWGPFTMDDRAWLETFNRDYPDTIPRDVRDMGVYWVARAEKDKKVKHSKTQWKQRLRTWSRIKVESGGGNGRHEKGGGSARALPKQGEYEPAPVYTRPLLRD